MNYNRVTIGGRLTRDPELRYTPSNIAVCRFGMAINRKWKDREDVTYVECEAWQKTAEIIAQHFAKGKPIFVDGRLTLQQWEKDGQKHQRMLVTVEAFQFIGGTEGGGGGGQQQERQQSYARPQQQASPAMTPPDDDLDGDIPF